MAGIWGVMFLQPLSIFGRRNLASIVYTLFRPTDRPKLKGAHCHSIQVRKGLWPLEVGQVYCHLDHGAPGWPRRSWRSDQGTIILVRACWVSPRDDIVSVITWIRLEENGTWHVSKWVGQKERLERKQLERRTTSGRKTARCEMMAPDSNCSRATASI